MLRLFGYASASKWLTK